MSAGDGRASRQIGARLTGDDLQLFESLGERDADRMRSLIRIARAYQESASETDFSDLVEQVTRRIGSMMASQESILIERLSAAVAGAVTESASSNIEVLSSIQSVYESLCSGHDKTHDMLNRGLQQVNELSHQRDAEALGELRKIRKELEDD